MDKNDRQYTNKDITVYWKPSECIHSTICYKELISVFNPAKRPWVNMKGGSTEEIINIVKRCPTQALTYTWNDERESEKPPEGKPNKQSDQAADAAKIEIIKGGPLLIEGNMEITGPDGEKLNHDDMVFFCRCGYSNNMPFCDGSHRDHDFDK